MVWVLLLSKMGQFPKGLVGLGVFTVIESPFLTVFGKKAGLVSAYSKRMLKQGGCSEQHGGPVMSRG